MLCNMVVVQSRQLCLLFSLLLYICAILCFTALCCVTVVMCNGCTVYRLCCAHRGAEESFDISADLQELARTPVTVVSSGVKSILGEGGRGFVCECVSA